jgi:hypothetical protein
MKKQETELQRLTKLWMEKTGGNEEDAVNWALDVIANDEKFEDFVPTEGTYTPLRDYLEELEKRLQ